MSSAPTTTRMAGRVNPAAGCEGGGELGGLMVSKAKSGSVNFEILVAVGFGGISQQFSGAAGAVPVAGQFEFPGEIAAGDDEPHIKRLRAGGVVFHPVDPLAARRRGISGGLRRKRRRRRRVRRYLACSVKRAAIASVAVESPVKVSLLSRNPRIRQRTVLPPMVRSLM